MRKLSFVSCKSLLLTTYNSELLVSSYGISLGLEAGVSGLGSTVISNTCSKIDSLMNWLMMSLQHSVCVYIGEYLPKRVYAQSMFPSSGRVYFRGRRQSYG